MDQYQTRNQNQSRQQLNVPGGLYVVRPPAGAQHDNSAAGVYRRETTGLATRTDSRGNTNAGQTSCASGENCRLKSVDISKSTHHCYGCKKRMHSHFCAKAFVEGGRMWCYSCGVPNNQPEDLIVVGAEVV